MAKQQEVIQREFTAEKLIPTDSFKLEVATFSKNVSIDASQPLLVGVEHCHFYHTFDSDGKRLTECNAIGGHKHKVDVEFDGNGQIVSFKSHPAADGHNHKMIYLKSDKIKASIKNAEAMKVIAGAI